MQFSGGSKILSASPEELENDMSLYKFKLVGVMTSENDKGFASLIDENGYAEIPNTYTTIGNYVFQNATSLTSIVIPDSVTSIGERAFLRLLDAKIFRYFLIRWLMRIINLPTSAKELFWLVGWGESPVADHGTAGKG